ncbi:MAG: hypothetical protein ACOC2H_08170 [Spirochaetota bacterium]
MKHTITLPAVSFSVLLLFTFTPLSAGISETVTQISDTVERISLVLDRTSFVVGRVRSVTGIKTLLFLLCILIICAGIGPTGLLYGRLLFFTAMLIADALWFFLLGAAYSSRQVLISDMVRANMWVLLPFILLLLVSQGVPYAYRHIKRYLAAGRLSRAEAQHALSQITGAHAELVDSLTEDIGRRTESRISLSPGTVHKARTLIKRLEILDRK